MVAARTPAISVRWHTPDDVAAMTRIHAECLPKERWEPADFARFAGKASRNNVAKVAVLPSGEAIATLLYTLTPGECVLRRVCVLPDFRRLGVGRKLLDRLTGRESNIRRLVFSARVREDYVPALLFFRDGMLGFHFDPEAPRHAYRDGKAGYTFQCRKPAALRRVLVAAAGD